MLVLSSAYPAPPHPALDRIDVPRSPRARHVADRQARAQFDQAPSAHHPPSNDMSLSVSPASADLEVLARLVAGDERALGVLYDRYGGMAFSLACAMVSDPTDAEEVVADAFAQLWRSASTFDPARGSVVAWISTITRTRALDLLRSRRRRARVLDEASVMSVEGSGPGLSAGAPAADRGAEISEARVLVRQSLADLPAPQRTVLELAYFGGLSQSEIAERLNEPLGTVKTRMRAGLEKMRQALKPLLETPA